MPLSKPLGQCWWHLNKENLGQYCSNYTDMLPWMTYQGWGRDLAWFLSSVELPAAPVLLYSLCKINSCTLLTQNPASYSPDAPTFIDFLFTVYIKWRILLCFSHIWYKFSYFISRFLGTERERLRKEIQQGSQTVK